MRLISFIILYLSISLSAQANYPIYNYSGKYKKISRDSFRKYVRPQARNIISEYYYLLKKINPLHKDLTEISKSIQDSYYIFEKLKETCSSNNKDCFPRVRTLYKKIRSIETRTLHFLNEKISLNGNPEQLDHVIILKSHLDDIEKITYKLNHLFENSLMTSGTIYKKNSFQPKEFHSLFNQLKIKAIVIISSLVVDIVRDDFEAVWINFISKLEFHIMRNSDRTYLLDHLGDLNIDWNNFHVRMRRGTSVLSQSDLKLIAIMHNRWNSILKIILRK